MNKNLTELKMKNRNGSHVGMMVSFAMFITFITFMYAILQPAVQTGGDKEVILNYIGNMILANVSANLTKIRINIDANPLPINTCINLSDLFLYTHTAPTNRTLVKNSTGDVQPSYFSLDNPGDLQINRTLNSITLLTVYISQNLNQTPESPVVCEDLTINGGYDIQVVTLDDYIFKESIESLNESYFYIYERLKGQLGIPAENEFGFIFRMEDDTNITAMHEQIIRTDTYVKEIPIQYVDEQADIKSGFITIKIW